MKSLKATIACSVIPMAIATFGAHRLIALWVGTRADLPTSELIWALFAWNTVVFLQQPFAYMLAGISEIRRTAVYALVGTIASAALMVILVHHMGQTGVVLGLLGGFVPFYFIGAVHQSFKVLRIQIVESKSIDGDELARQPS